MFVRREAAYKFPVSNGRQYTHTNETSIQSMVYSPVFDVLPIVPCVHFLVRSLCVRKYDVLNSPCSCFSCLVLRVVCSLCGPALMCSLCCTPSVDVFFSCAEVLLRCKPSLILACPGAHVNRSVRVCTKASPDGQDFVP